MSKISRTSAPNVMEFPLAIDHQGDTDDYTVDFVTIRQTHSLADALAGLPDGRCQCPHWGYLFSGRLTVDYGDRTEVIEPGDAFYMPPGHVPSADAGSELVQFSPKAELAATQAAINRHMQSLQKA